MFNRKEQRNGQGEIRQRLQGAGGNAPAYKIPWPWLRGLVEDGRPCERAHGPRLDRRKVEVEMIYKRAGNHWKTPARFDRRQTDQEEEESQPLQRTGTPRSLKDITRAKPRRAPWK